MSLPVSTRSSARCVRLVISRQIVTDRKRLQMSVDMIKPALALPHFAAVT